MLAADFNSEISASSWDYSKLLEVKSCYFILVYCFQLILVGVCCSAGADGSDPYSEVSLQPLPEYAVPSDGVTMTCITCTEKGRIFLAGRDGHIYELYYTTGSGWHKRCRKICLTAGIGSVISRYLSSSSHSILMVNTGFD